MPLPLAALSGKRKMRLHLHPAREQDQLPDAHGFVFLVEL